MRLNKSNWNIDFDKIDDSTRRNYLSLLPEQQRLMEYFSQVFVLNKPKGSVGGDGFWLHNHNGVVYLAFFTCFNEGHLASMMIRVYVNLLKKMVEKHSINLTESILKFLHKEVQTKFENKNNILLNTNANVGIVRYDTKTKTMEYAGANMNLLQVHRRGIKIIQGEEIGIGRVGIKDYDYKPTILENIEDSNFFLCSTGVFNLKNNPNFKHLSMNLLGEFLRHKRKESMEDQKKIVLEYLSNCAKMSWENNDIMIIGFKL